jgi:hypothetical protein
LPEESESHEAGTNHVHLTLPEESRDQVLETQGSVFPSCSHEDNGPFFDAADMLNQEIDEDEFITREDNTSTGKHLEFVSTPKCNSDAIMVLKEKLFDVKNCHHELPDWVRDLQPSYDIGNKLGDQCMEEIIFCKENHDSYREKLTEILQPCWDIIKENFDPNSRNQLWDTQEETTEMEKNWQNFLILLERAREEHLPKIDKTAKQVPVPEEDSATDFYKPVNNDQDLEKNFDLYLAQKKAKAKGTILAQKTRESYVNAVFSRTKATSFVNYCKQSGIEAWMYMFNPNGKYLNLPESADQFLCAGIGLSAATAKMNCNGLQALVKYFKRAAQNIQAPDDVEDYRLGFIAFKNNFVYVIKGAGPYSFESINFFSPVHSKMA